MFKEKDRKSIIILVLRVLDCMRRSQSISKLVCSCLVMSTVFVCSLNLGFYVWWCDSLQIFFMCVCYFSVWPLESWILMKLITSRRDGQPGGTNEGRTAKHNSKEVDCMCGCVHCVHCDCVQHVSGDVTKIRWDFPTLKNRMNSSSSFKSSWCKSSY